MNLYGYSQNRIMNWRDPFGLSSNFAPLPVGAGEPISTLAWGKVKCRNYKEGCMQECLLRVGGNYLVGATTLGLLPVSLSLDGEVLQITFTSVVGSGLSAAKLSTQMETRARKNFDVALKKQEKIQNRNNKYSKKSKNVNSYKRLTIISKVIKLIPAVGTLYISANFMNDIISCADQCEN